MARLQLYSDAPYGVLVIAHRGDSAHYPENTLAAFKGALETGADMIELDVRLSADGVPVVFHDRKLNIHTNGKGPVNAFTVEELKQLDAGSWFGPRFAHERIPTLEEALAWSSGKIALNIEIKPTATDTSGTVEKRCFELVRKFGMEHHVLFSSFNYDAVAKLKELDPTLTTAVIYNRVKSKRRMPHELVNAYRADAFNCSFRQLNRRRKDDLKQHAIPHFIYTVDEPNQMKRLLDVGVTGIFTNKPGLLIEVASGYRAGVSL